MTNGEWIRKCDDRDLTRLLAVKIEIPDGSPIYLSYGTGNIYLNMQQAYEDSRKWVESECK